MTVRGGNSKRDGQTDTGKNAANAKNPSKDESNPSQKNSGSNGIANLCFCGEYNLSHICLRGLVV
jgi:hypothetical protein